MRLLVVAILSIATCTAILTATDQGADVLGSQPNIVLIVADDLGVDLVDAYGEGMGQDQTRTRTIDRIAKKGLLFRNAWSSPFCTPSRAQILTGRHGFRTGIGNNVRPSDPNNPGLKTTEFTIPKMLGSMTGYHHAAVGKWHLGDPSQGLLHPLHCGFGEFTGSMYQPNHGFPGADYFNYLKNTNGSESASPVYATTDTTNDAISRAAAMQSMGAPWFLYVSYNAAHTPLHAPPESLHSYGPLPEPPDDHAPLYTKAMVEAMDREIRRMLRSIYELDPNLFVIFIGDNGTSKNASEPPFAPNHAKGKLFEGGINVPMIIFGAGVRRGECQALVSSTDLFATIAEVAGVSNPNDLAEDSVSLVPYFAGPIPSIRNTVYAEKFRPNMLNTAFFGPTSHTQAIRDSRYKLIRTTTNQGAQDELYDLINDPFETNNLLGSGLTCSDIPVCAALETALPTIP